MLRFSLLPSLPPSFFPSLLVFFRFNWGVTFPSCPGDSNFSLLICQTNHFDFFFSRIDLLVTKYLSFFCCCCFYCQIIFFLGLSRYLGLCFYWCGDHVAYTGMGSQCVYSCVYIVSENFCLLGNVGNLW